VVFDVSGTVTLGCNIHDWMVAYLTSCPPYFANRAVQTRSSAPRPAATGSS
jgi:hypothetical protein